MCDFVLSLLDVPPGSRNFRIRYAAWKIRQPHTSLPGDVVDVIIRWYPRLLEGVEGNDEQAEELRNDLKRAITHAVQMGSFVL